MTSRVDQWDPNHPTEQQINVLAAFGRRVRPEAIAEVQDLPVSTVERLLESAVSFDRDVAKQIVAGHRANPSAPAAKAVTVDEEPDPMVTQPTPATTTTAATDVAVAANVDDLTLDAVQAQLEAIAYTADLLRDEISDLSTQVGSALSVVTAMAAKGKESRVQIQALRDHVAALNELLGD